MRDFYRTYGNPPSLLSRAMELGWIQNVVIMEAELTMELRKWYMKAAKQFGWSKTELIANIAEKAHERIVLSTEDDTCNVLKREKKWTESKKEIKDTIQQLGQRIRKWRLICRGHRRRWRTCYAI
jgi:hypothetical protein